MGPFHSVSFTLTRRARDLLLSFEMHKHILQNTDRKRDISPVSQSEPLTASTHTSGERAGENLLSWKEDFLNVKIPLRGRY